MSTKAIYCAYLLVNEKLLIRHFLQLRLESPSHNKVDRSPTID